MRPVVKLQKNYSVIVGFVHRPAYPLQHHYPLAVPSPLEHSGDRYPPQRGFITHLRNLLGPPLAPKFIETEGLGRSRFRERVMNPRWDEHLSPNDPKVAERVEKDNGDEGDMQDDERND